MNKNNVLGNSYGNAFQIPGYPFQYNVLVGSRVTVEAVSDSVERGKRARPQSELG